MTNLTPEAVNAARERVTQFLMLQLPGQPMMMHMGTSHLVSELDAIARDWLRLKKIEEVGKEAFETEMLTGGGSPEAWAKHVKALTAFRAAVEWE